VSSGSCPGKELFRGVISPVNTTELIAIRIICSPNPPSSVSLSLSLVVEYFMLLTLRRTGGIKGSSYFYFSQAHNFAAATHHHSISSPFSRYASKSEKNVARKLFQVSRLPSPCCLERAAERKEEPEGKLVIRRDPFPSSGPHLFPLEKTQQEKDSM